MGAKCFAVCTICMIPLLLLVCIGMFGLSIAEIVMGAIYKDECPKEFMIPIYLIVSGVMGIFFSGGSGSNVKNRKKEDGGGNEGRTKCMSVCTGIITLFVLGWFIAGHVFVFSIQYDHDTTKNITSIGNGTTDMADVINPNYCNETLYLFAFWSIIAKWIVFAATIFIVVCLVCGAACAACCESG